MKCNDRSLISVLEFLEWSRTCLICSAQKSLDNQHKTHCMLGTILLFCFQSALGKLVSLFKTKCILNTINACQKWPSSWFMGFWSSCFGVVKSFSYLKVQYSHHISLFSEAKAFNICQCKVQCGLALPSFPSFMWPQKTSYQFRLAVCEKSLDTLINKWKIWL